MEQLKKAWHNHIATSMQNTQESVEQNTIQNDITKQKEQENNNKDTMLQRLQEKEKLQKIYNNEIRGQIALYITKIHIFPKHILEKNLLFIQELIHEAQTMQIQIDSNLIESIKELQQALQFSQDCNAYKKVNTISNSRLCKYGQNASFFSKF